MSDTESQKYYSESSEYESSEEEQVEVELTSKDIHSKLYENKPINYYEYLEYYSTNHFNKLTQNIFKTLVRFEPETIFNIYSITKGTELEANINMRELIDIYISSCKGFDMVIRDKILSRLYNERNHFEDNAIIGYIEQL